MPGKVAVVAEIDEDWTTPVDTRMEPIGGIVFRRALSAVKDTVNSEETAAMKADIAQIKAEHAQAHADRKARIQEKINQLIPSCKLDYSSPKKGVKPRSVTLRPKSKYSRQKRQLQRPVRRKRCGASGRSRRAMTSASKLLQSLVMAAPYVDQLMRDQSERHPDSERNGGTSNPAPRGWSWQSLPRTLCEQRKGMLHPN